MTRTTRLFLIIKTLSLTVMAVGGCQSPLHQSGTTVRERGERLYRHHCAGCHAPRGTGDAFLGIPALAGQRLEYLQRQVERFSSDQRHSNRMQWAFSRVAIDEPDAPVAVATYLSSLPVQRYAVGDARHLAEGRMFFMRDCAACHGTDARGSAAGAIPSLRAQHDSYLVNRLRALAATPGPAGGNAHVMDESRLIAVSAFLSSLKGVALDADLPSEP